MDIAAQSRLLAPVNWNLFVLPSQSILSRCKLECRSSGSSLCRRATAAVASSAALAFCGFSAVTVADSAAAASDSAAAWSPRETLTGRS